MFETDDLPTGSRNTKRRGMRRVFIGLLILFLAAGIYTQFFQHPPVALGVLSSETSADGQHVTSGEISGSPTLAGQVTAIQANNSTSTATSSSRGSGATWPRDSVAIFCESDHLLMQRVGLALFEGLKKTEQFPQIYYVPRGQSLPPGQEVPDILVSLSMPDYQESGLPIAKQYQLKLKAHVGREFAHGSTYTITNSTPPVVNFSSNIQMDYSAKQTGVETSGAQYTAVSNDIAKSLQKAVLDIFKKDEDLELPARDQIPEFFPQYQSPPEFSFLKTLQAQSKFSGPRFMQPTSAAWTFTSDLTIEELHEQIETPLLADGWKGRDAITEQQASGLYYGQWSRGGESLSLLPEKDGGSMAPQESSSGGPQVYSVIYTRGMTNAEVEQAFLTVLTRPITESMLLPFVNQWHLGKDQLIEYFDKHMPTQANSYRILAEWKLHAKDQSAAQELILHGYAMDRLVGNGSQQSTFEQLAKKAGMGKLPDRLMPEVIETLGLQDFREGKEFEITCNSGEQICLWVESGELEQSVLKLRPVKKRSGLWSLSHEVITIRDHGSSSTSSSAQEVSLQTPHPLFAGLNDVRLELVAESTGNPDQIRYRVTRRDLQGE